MTVRRGWSQDPDAYSTLNAYQSSRARSWYFTLPRLVRDSPTGCSRAPRKAPPPQLQWGCSPARSWMRTRILLILASRSTSRWNWWYRASHGVPWKNEATIFGTEPARPRWGPRRRGFPDPGWEGHGRLPLASPGGMASNSRASVPRLPLQGGGGSCCTTPTDA